MLGWPLQIPKAQFPLLGASLVSSPPPSPPPPQLLHPLILWHFRASTTGLHWVGAENVDFAYREHRGGGGKKGYSFPSSMSSWRTSKDPPTWGSFLPPLPLPRAGRGGCRTPGSDLSRFPAAFWGPGPTLPPCCDSAGTPGVWLLPTLQFTEISCLYSAFI